MRVHRVIKVRKTGTLPLDTGAEAPRTPFVVVHKVKVKVNPAKMLRKLLGGFFF